MGRVINTFKKSPRLIALFVVAIFTFFLIPIIGLPKLPSKVKTQESTVLAQVSKPIPAKPKASVKGATAPQNLGRSVRVPILMYHYIGNNPNPKDKTRDSLSVSPDLFEGQMQWLSQNGYNAISLDTLYAALKGGLLPSKPVVLTFDDGYIDFYLNAFPILRKYNLHATEFIPTHLVGTGTNFYMSWGQIKELQGSGLISFAAHSLTHPNLTALSPKVARAEIAQSKKELEAQLGVPINFFAYPYGISNSATWQMVKDAGFLGSVGTWYGTTESEGNAYNWPRVRIGGGTTVAQFASKLR